MISYFAIVKKALIWTMIPALFVLNGCGGSGGGGGNADGNKLQGLEKATEQNFDQTFGGVYIEKGKAPVESRGLFLAGDSYTELIPKVSADGVIEDWTTVESIGLSSSTNSLKKVNTTFNRDGFKFFTSFKNISITGTKLSDKELRITRTGTSTGQPNIDIVFEKQVEEETNTQPSTPNPSSGSGSGWTVVF